MGKNPSFVYRRLSCGASLPLCRSILVNRSCQSERSVKSSYTHRIDGPFHSVALGYMYVSSICARKPQPQQADSGSDGGGGYNTTQPRSEYWPVVDDNNVTQSPSSRRVCVCPPPASNFSYNEKRETSRWRGCCSGEAGETRGVDFDHLKKKLGALHDSLSFSLSHQ